MRHQLQPPQTVSYSYDIELNIQTKNSKADLDEKDIYIETDLILLCLAKLATGL